MSEIELTVNNDAGIHLQVAGKIVRALSPLKSNVMVIKGNMKLNAKSIIGLTGMAASKGTLLKFVADGEDEQTAIERLRELFESNFE